MKKQIVLLLSIFILSGNLFSQTFFGFVGGVNFSQLSGDNPDFDMQIPRIGMYGGITLDVILKHNTYLQIGGMYSQQGSVLKSSYFLTGQKVTYKEYNNVDYFTLPLTWKQLWGDFFTQMGIYGQTPIIAKSYWKKEIDYANSSWDTISGPIKSFTSNLRHYDVGIFFAFGLQVPISYQYDWYLNVSFRQGFFPIKTQKYYDNINQSAEDIIRNRVFSINTGIIIFGKKGRNANRIFSK